MPLRILALLIFLTAHAVATRADDPVEIEYWQSVKESKSVAALQSYLAKFPDGQFADLARIRIRALGGDSKAVTAPGEPPRGGQVAPAAAPQPTGLGWIGATFRDVSDQDAAALKAIRRTSREGAVVASVVTGGPAEKAGLKPGEIIHGVMGRDGHSKGVPNSVALQKFIESWTPGMTLTLFIDNAEVAKTGDSRIVDIQAGRATEPGGAAGELVPLPECKIKLVHQGWTVYSRKAGTGPIYSTDVDWDAVVKTPVVDLNMSIGGAGRMCREDDNVKGCDVLTLSQKSAEGEVVSIRFHGLTYRGRDLIAAEIKLKPDSEHPIRLEHHFKRQDNGKEHVSEKTLYAYDDSIEGSVDESFLSGAGKVAYSMVVNGQPFFSTEFDWTGLAGAVSEAERIENEVRGMARENRCDVMRF